MSLKPVEKEALQHLFQLYKDNPNFTTNTIGVIAARHSVVAMDLANSLKAKGMLKPDVMFLPDGTVQCNISVSGIREINSSFYHSTVNAILKGLGQKGGSGNIVEILATPIQLYQIPFDFTDELVRLGLVSGQHGNFASNFIWAELTVEGKLEYQNRTDND